MIFSKTTLSPAEMGYSVSRLTLLGEVCIIAASEGPGPAYVFRESDPIPITVSTSPGGSMGFAPFPDRDDVFLMISRFYPIFKAENAGIELLQEVDGFEKPWKSRRVVNLPFVHRIASMATPAGNFLIAATVCGGKEFQDDWSKPGSVYVIEIPDDVVGSWKPIPIIEGLHRNHGMTEGRINGRDALLISSDEGVFALYHPTEQGGEWASEMILDRPVSEVGLIDLDGDGEDELVTIEPFHGETLGVYKKDGSSWTLIESGELAFGHGLSVGHLGKTPVIVVGNRAGSNDLVCYYPAKTQALTLHKTIVDSGAASAGSAIISTKKGSAIVTSNPAFSEYAIYIPQGELS